MARTYVPGAALKIEQEMFVGLETIRDSICHRQHHLLQVKANQQIFFFKGLETVLVFFTLWEEDWLLHHDLHLHGCSSVWKEMLTVKTEYGAFQLFLNHSRWAHYQLPGCASISECFMWKISCCATLTSSLVTWWLALPSFSLQKIRRQLMGGTDLKHSAFTGSLTCRYKVERKKKANNARLEFKERCSAFSVSTNKWSAYIIYKKYSGWLINSLIPLSNYLANI